MGSAGEVGHYWGKVARQDDMAGVRHRSVTFGVDSALPHWIVLV
jgi:hypothetical protein